MKKAILKKGIALLACLGIAFGAVVGVMPAISAKAGMSTQHVINEEMYKEELSNQKWYYTRDILHQDGKIVFDKQSTTEESKIVSIILANDLREMNIETCINGTVTVKVNESLDGEFFIGFGLTRPYSAVNSASAICLYDNGGEIGVRVKNFTGENAGVVYEGQTTYAYGEELVINFDVFSVGSMYLSINDTTLLNHDNEKSVFSNGYFGFGQSAASSVEIYNAEVFAASYDTPTNSNFTETFDDGFNANLLYSEGGSNGYFTPENVVCEDGVLKFNNVTNTGYISTKQEYSNFSMSFDIPHIQRQAVLDADGNVTTPATNWMGFSIGCSTVKTNSSVAVAQSLFFFMMPTYVNGKSVSMTCTLLNNYKQLKSVSVSGEHNFFATENGLDGEGKERTVNFKLEMIDGVLTVYSKYENDPVNRFYKMFEYDLGYTPLGYVQIWGYGDDFSYVQNNIAAGRESFCANYWIDNLKLENRDENALLVEVDFKSSKFPTQDDFVYVDRWDNRAETLYAADAPETSGCGSSVSLSAAALALVAGAAMFINKGGKKE